MTGPIFDTHAHYSARAFDADRFALLDSLPEKGVVGVCEQAYCFTKVLLILKILCNRAYHHCLQSVQSNIRQSLFSCTL